VVLLLFTMVTGGIGALSNATYWPLVGRFGPHCMTALSVGMTVGGMVTQMFAVAQNAGHVDDLNFEPTTYFFIVAAVQVLLCCVMIPIARMRSTQALEEQGSSKERVAEEGITAQQSSQQIAAAGGVASLSEHKKYTKLPRISDALMEEDYISGSERTPLMGTNGSINSTADAAGTALVKKKGTPTQVSDNIRVVIMSLGDNVYHVHGPYTLRCRHCPRLRRLCVRAVCGIVLLY
jgi:hypothetical protein